MTGVWERVFGERRFKTFTNSEERYTLEIPNHWMLKKVTPEYGHSFSDPESKEGMLSIKPAFVPDSSLQEYHDALLEGMKKELKYTFLTSTDTRVDGKQAREITLLAPAYAQGKKKRAVLTVLIVDERAAFRYLVMSFSVLESDYERHVDVYRHARETLRF